MRRFPSSAKRLLLLLIAAPVFVLLPACSSLGSNVPIKASKERAAPTEPRRSSTHDSAINGVSPQCPGRVDLAGTCCPKKWCGGALCPVDK